MGFKHAFLLYSVCAAAGGNACASFLEPADFPKTINDVSFTDRTKNQAAGYAPFADADPYIAIQLQSVNDALADEVARIEKEHELYCLGAGRDKPECQPYTPPAQEEPAPQEQEQPAQDTQNQQTQNQQQQNQAQNQIQSQNSQVIPNGAPGTYCALKHPHIKPGQTLPLGVPISPKLDIYAKARRGEVCSGFAVARGSGWRHHGVDLGCKAQYFGEPVFATGDGRVSMVKKWDGKSTAGNYIAIDHVDGFRSYYMHLDTINVTQGQNVSAGCQIGTLGHTGGSVAMRKAGKPWRIQKSGSHLHYELKNNKHPSSINTPKGPIKIKQYLDNSFDPIELLKYQP